MPPNSYRSAFSKVVSVQKAGERINAQFKARLLVDKDSAEWHLPSKPNGIRWATYQQWLAECFASAC